MRTFKGVNETDLEYKKRVLDKLSPSFCGAKWYNATIYLGTGTTCSCHYNPPHKIPKEELKNNCKVLHNTSQKKDERLMMQQGERPPGCNYCWKIEDMNKVSDRPYKSMYYSDEELNDAYNSSHLEDVNLKTLEVGFDRNCQFACSYCSPGVSTSWIKDIEKNGPYTDLKMFDQYYLPDEDNPYIEAFFKWWEEDLHKSLHEMRITGGEPLMSKHTWRLLDWFKNNKEKSNLDFVINSNLGFNKGIINKLLNSIDNLSFILYTSNESCGNHSEYIRDGLIWEQWVNNVTCLLESKKLKQFNIMATINALCLESITEFMDLVVTWKKTYGKNMVSFSLNIMRDPIYQGICVLPDHLRKMYRDKIQEWYVNNKDLEFLQEAEITQIERLISYLEQVKTPYGANFDRNLEEKNFKRFYTQYDQRRNKDLTKTFGNELVTWYESIQIN